MTSVLGHHDAAVGGCGARSVRVVGQLGGACECEKRPADDSEYKNGLFKLGTVVLHCQQERP